MVLVRFVLLALLTLPLFSTVGCGGSSEPQLIEGAVMDNGGMSEAELNNEVPPEETSGAY
ncbi:hypothetical protein [Aporhodopirellula aestuarii]|uniref:Secreted protein n=1 Tax=Aporhodopirellula aestuarii TaxID=2950107 RepID=A0ABT0TZV6_9BACT|nr:hypothetical protein [Aporhodopirellula aestuarii]MCM2370138.1 hypothetical protein [Aporhodopirellula aestuarii]